MEQHQNQLTDIRNTRILRIASDGSFSEAEQAGLREAGRMIREGGLVAFPTETVYGLGGDALNPDSSRKIYAAKGRPSDNPLIVHIAQMEALPRIVADIPQAAVMLADAFWPGPLTMILRKSDAVPLATTGGLQTVAVRMPSHPVALALIRESGGYIAAPSANTSGKPSPTKAVYVAEDLNGKIDMIIDGGELGIGLESTIVDLTVEPPQILRPGYVTAEMLSRVVGEVDTDVTILQDGADCGQAPKAPGMKYRHYAPKGELTLVQGTRQAVVDYINRKAGEARMAGEKVGVIATAENFAAYDADCVKNIGSREDEATVARGLYTILREFDDEQVTRIYSEAFETRGFGQAIMNRLLKAAGHHVEQAE
ncbi:MAG: threonylcarbamoyl-AMP synthase [Lachnospiraceae bacterium]|nr:threonylcarbamoyl-AMP synthase [Lachnospiraceae bacterium]